MGTFGGKTRTSGQGRPKGAKNKVTLHREAEIKATGITPLDYMLETLRREDATVEDRRWAAQNAAPYVHPRLSSIEAKAEIKADVQSTTDRDRAKAVAALVAKARKAE